MNMIHVRKKLESFLQEDLGTCDLTSESIFPPHQKGNGIFLAKDEGVISGLEMIHEIYRLLDPSIKVKVNFQDGDEIQYGDIIAEINGPIRHLLTGERVILNLIQRMSAISTMTRKCIDALNDPTIQICDTRKTTPGLRIFEKYAVRVGGGKNHRQGLYDGVMIKDNHIAFSGSITRAVESARKSVGHMVKIEVETETIEEVREAVEANVDVIMFDNRTPEEVKEFSQIVPKQIITEASGGITLESLPAYAHTGVDYISLGFLTHSIHSLDLSLNVDMEA